MVEIIILTFFISIKKSSNITKVFKALILTLTIALLGLFYIKKCSDRGIYKVTSRTSSSGRDVIIKTRLPPF